jgi:hypothetical protein
MAPESAKKRGIQPCLAYLWRMDRTLRRGLSIFLVIAGVTIVALLVLAFFARH